jgi:23S rRNA pseudouridine2605 synthase
MANKPFQKFIEQKESGAKKKERIRQEKKKIRQETKAYFEKKKAERWGGPIPVGNLESGAGGRGSSRESGAGRENQDMRSERSANKNKDVRGAVRPPIQKKDAPKQQTSPSRQRVVENEGNFKPQTSNLKPQTTNLKPQNPNKPDTGQMPLNKFIAHAGICARRDAAELVKSGKVTVNGQKIIEPGFKVTNGDEIKVQGKKISARKNLVYILLNKPKDFITTTEDPQGRKTVLDIVKSATTERVYPIGRLDRNTTGVLLLTNDGELAQKLSHPSYEVRKIYEVTLDRQVTKKDFDTIAAGVTLEDGFVQPDALAYPDAKNKHIIGIEIHSGRNRIVRRIFEQLGYDVRNLDRVMYANLTKKNVDRGKWRFLSEKEVRLLKFLNASYSRK